MLEQAKAPFVSGCATDRQKRASAVCAVGHPPPIIPQQVLPHSSKSRAYAPQDCRARQVLVTMSKDTVLITGASGFVGSAVARKLVEAGFAVRALVRSTSPRRHLDGLDLEFFEGDLRDP